MHVFLISGSDKVQNYFYYIWVVFEISESHCQVLAKKKKGTSQVVNENVSVTQ